MNLNYFLKKLKRSDRVNAYGGVNLANLKLVEVNGAGGAGQTTDLTSKEKNANQQANKLAEMSDYWLFQIQSTVLM